MIAKNLFQDAREDVFLVDLRVDGVEFGETDEIGADEQTELAALLLAPIAVSRVALMLHPHPQLVHLREVGQDELDRVADRARARAFARRVVLKLRLLHWRTVDDHLGEEG